MTPSRFFKVENLPRFGGVLVACTVFIALIWANSFQHSYQRLWTSEPWEIGVSARGFVNQVLLTGFFALVGLEVRREFTGGALSSLRKSAVPIAVAISGMIGPALTYLAVVRHGPALRAWCVPMATDVALSLAAFSLIQGPHISPRARLFLLTFGTVDDILSVLVLLLVDPASLNVGLLLLGTAAIAAAIVVWFKRGKAPVRLVLLVLVWGLTLVAGAEAALVGVLFGALGPSRGQSPQRLERYLTPLVLLGIVPLFALANAGVVIHSSIFDSPELLAIFLGVFLARILGKPVGIFVGARLSRRFEAEGTVAHIDDRNLGGVAALAGIGFTVPLLMISVVLGSGEMASAAVVGLLSGILVASLFGTLALKLFRASP